MTDTPERPTRVLLLRSGDGEVAAVSAGNPAPGWRPLMDSALTALLPHLFTEDGSPASTASVRYFTMRPQDLNAWDTLRRHGKAGYSYGTLWGETGISQNVQFKETAPPRQVASGPPVDPVALATAIAVAQIQADIKRLMSLVEDVALDVKAILHFLQLGQEAEVLAATETIQDIYLRFCSDLSVGFIDWDRLAGLEQVLKTQHRQIVGELESIAVAMAFTTVKEARAAARITPDRFQNLITLDAYVLDSLAKWSEMMLSARASRGENSLAAASETRTQMQNYVADLRTVLGKVNSATSVMSGRGFWEKLFDNGFVVGSRRDAEAQNAAMDRRTELRQLASVHKRLPGPGEIGLIALTNEPAHGGCKAALSS